MNDNGESGRDLQQGLRRARRLARHVWSHFQEDRCFEEAASLGYTSLLSMIPLLAVAFGILSLFPVFNEWSASVQSFIFDNFLPDAGEQIVPYINTFLSSVSGLTLPGTITLIVTALLLMVRIEVAFNRIWRVDRNRPLTNRIVLYWALMTLGPLLIAAAVALSAQKIFGDAGMVGTLPPGLQNIGTFLLGWLVFSLFFLFVPNRPVRIKHALIGAFLTAVLFEIAKAGFVAYVSNANYKVIYGALATVPLFLFWLYLVWVVVLLGASLAASLTTFSDYRKHETDWPKKWEFQLAYRLLGHLWKAQQRGESLSRLQLLELEPQASEMQIVRLLARMREQRIVTNDADGDILLRRDLDELSLADLYSHGDYHLPISDTGALPLDSEWDRAYVDCLEHMREHGRDFWNRPLKRLYRGNDDGGPR
jgi:membrane protein